MTKTRRKIRGEGRVFQRSGSQYWWLQYSHRGKTYWESSKSADERVAIKLLNQRIEEIRQGRKPQKEVEKITFSDLLRLIRNDYKIERMKSEKRLETSIKHLEASFGNDHAVDISAERIDAYILNRRDEGASDSSIQKETAALKRMFTLAIQKKILVEKPYIPSIDPKNARTGFFEDDEFERLIGELNGEIKPLALFGYITGWRVGEIKSLQWRQVDLNGGIIRLAPNTTKNGEGRTFPFSAHPTMEKLIHSQKERAGIIGKANEKIVPWGFPRSTGGQIKNFREAWSGACKRAKIPGRIFHDFRRTTVRRLERAGVPRSTAMELTGHKTEAIYRRYAITSEADKVEAIRKLH